MKRFKFIWHTMKLLKLLHFFRKSLYISQRMGGHRVANKGEKLQWTISFPVERCLTSHSRPEINKMKFEESECKSLNHRVTGFTKLMSVYFVKNNAVTIYSMFSR